MAKFFEFSFVDEGVSARARLLEAEAPVTVATLWRQAPYEGQVGHAIYSGTTCALYIDPAITLPMEHATTQVHRGDVMFTHYDAMQRHGFPEALSEIYWAYDRYCRPTMPGAMLPVAPNVFGVFEEDFEAFFEASRRIRHEGQKRITVTKIET